MKILLFFTIITFFLFIIMLNEESRFRKDCFSRKIKNYNKIRFTKLIKDYLKDSKDDDIKDLITCLFLELKERRKK